MIGMGGNILPLRAGGILLSWITMILVAGALLYHAFA